MWRPAASARTPASQPCNSSSNSRNSSRNTSNSSSNNSDSNNGSSNSSNRISNGSLAPAFLRPSWGEVLFVPPFCDCVFTVSCLFI